VADLPATPESASGAADGRDADEIERHPCPRCGVDPGSRGMSPPVIRTVQGRTFSRAAVIAISASTSTRV